jgi:trans-aconitate methyltransferase
VPHLHGVTVADRFWAGWVDRWERQQERYLPERETRFALMLDYAEAQLGGAPDRVLDLCCGNGALTRRVLDRFPETHVTAVDWDPVHLEIARRTLPAKVEIVEADISRPGWAGAIEPGLDLVVSATAVHWFEQAQLNSVYAALAELLREGGLFLNADHLPPDEPRISELGEELTTAWQHSNFANGEETHADFHAAAAADPVLRAAAEVRAERFGEHGTGDSRTLDVQFHRTALRQAGFRETAEVWRFRDDAVLLALR